MKYINTEKLIIKSWCNTPEEGAITQAKNLANLPFSFKQICLMPDVHQGYGMPIGGVLACKDAIIPNAVGVDIGCSMLACRTSLQELDVERLKKIMGLIRETVPVGFKHSDKPCPNNFMPKLIYTKIDMPYSIVCQEYESARRQMGTLGGGNHFIEIQKGNDGFIWFMIHSGSRNLGKKVADYYNNVAKELNSKWYSNIPKEWDLAFLPLFSDEGQAYRAEMDYCVEFSYQNKRSMKHHIMNAFEQIIPTCEFTEDVSIPHNYARLENHYGQNVVVHRKGAVSAKEGELGIIPGSQGTCSYIVKGKGNPESFMSCSHGAGRRMGRKEAIRSLDFKEEVAKLDARGIVHAIRNKDDLEEASGAYKDIDVVMEEQKDLVDIVVKLEPMGVIKG